MAKEIQWEKRLETSLVIDFFTQHVIPLQLPHDHKPLSDEFRVKWTPTLVTLDKACRIK